MAVLGREEERLLCVLPAKERRQLSDMLRRIMAVAEEGGGAGWR
ncbi:hypothetical protein [Streptomyces venezuelae]